MSLQATVTYFFHSGFSVEIGETLLIFDYWEGAHHQSIPDELKITPQTLAMYKKVFVFISHSHPDHLDDIVFTWKDHPDIAYIVSYDMPIGVRGKRLAPQDQLRLSDQVKVTAYESTDLGVSFMVDAFGLRIFHAGDLNLWHWREESSLREIEAAEEAYEKAVAPLTGQHIDLCMFPVDPRMGYLFDAGAQHFLLATKPRLFIPMHWHGRVEVAQDFARRSRSKYTEILPLTQPGEFALLVFDEQELKIQVVSPTSYTSPVKRMDTNPTSSDPLTYRNTLSPSPIEEFYTKENPFADSDLPVSLEEDPQEDDPGEF